MTQIELKFKEFEIFVILYYLIFFEVKLFLGSLFIDIFI